MTTDRAQTPGPGIDTVEVSRIERLIADTPEDDLRALFSVRELADAGSGPGRAASLAARFAAKEACCKVFPRETALGVISPSDFSLTRDAYGAPTVVPTATARAVMDRYRIRELRVSLTHTETTASAIATPEANPIDVPWFGKWLFHFVPLRRRVVLENLTPRLRQLSQPG